MSHSVLNMYPNSTLWQIGNLHHATFNRGQIRVRSLVPENTTASDSSYADKTQDIPV